MSTLKVADILVRENNSYIPIDLPLIHDYRFAQIEQEKEKSKSTRCHLVFTLATFLKQSSLFIFTE